MPRSGFISRLLFREATAHASIKSKYAQKNGWGNPRVFSQEGEAPAGDRDSSGPAEDPLKRFTRRANQMARDMGMEVTENPDGTVTVRKPSV